MRLSEFDLLNPFIARDGEFARLGSASLSAPDLLVYADSIKYLSVAIKNPHCRCIITSEKLSSTVPKNIGLVLHSSPRCLFYDVHEQLLSEGLYLLPFQPNIEGSCRIHPTAQIEAGCRIESGVTIAEHVVIRAPVWIGKNVTIEPGAKVGVDGILYRGTISGPKLIPHGGYVRVDDGAILMTNSVIVRSVHDSDPTIVGNSALIGLGTIIGHDAKVGMRAIVSNQCVVARGSTIGDDAFLGTHSTIREHIRVGSGARVMAGSVVISDVPDLTTVSGNFATDHTSRLLGLARASR